MDANAVVGLVAGALTTVSFVPQVFRALRTRRTTDLSLGFTLLFVAGVALWLAYGLREGLLPVVLWNAITLALVGALAVAKIRHG